MKAGGVLLVLLVWTAATFPAEASTRKFGIIVGNNQGHDPTRTLRYAERDALKMRDVLLQLGGFEAQDLNLLQRGNATLVKEALREVEQVIKNVHGINGTRTLLLFYYSGHAEGDVLELGKSSLAFDELRQFLHSSSADVRLAFIDSCKSGKLVAAKGGQPSDGFEIRVDEEMESSGYAIITSSANDELSQEAEDIRGSVFTHYLVSALRGGGDLTPDGKVTLSEAYRYAYQGTVARTSLIHTGIQHPMYDFKLAGRGEVVLTQLTDKKNRLVIEGIDTGRVVVLNRDRDTMVAETEAAEGKPLTLFLQPGSYLVFAVFGNNVREAPVSIETGRDARLAQQDFTSTTLDRPMSKGGLFRRSWVHTLTGQIILRSQELESGRLAAGAGVSYGVGRSAGVQAQARLFWTTAPDAGSSVNYNDVGLMGGVAYALPFGSSVFQLVLQAGYGHLFQVPREGDVQHSSAFVYLVGSEIVLPVGPLAVVLDLGGLGRVFKTQDRGVVHRLDVQMNLGLGWQWEN